MKKTLNTINCYFSNLLNEVLMQKIIKETPNIVKARSTAITDVKLISDKLHKVGSRTIEFQVTGTKGDLYKVVFYFKDKWDIRGDVKVYCSCPMMRWWGPSWNSKIEGFRLWQMAKDVPPDVRDPKRIQKVCKHIIAAYQKLPEADKQMKFDFMNESFSHEVMSGEYIADRAREMGSDGEGGIIDWTYDRIKKENYIVQEVPIDNLLKFDLDLAEYIKNAKEVRPFEGAEFSMYPIVRSDGDVIDGYNRIHQAILNGEKTITIFKGVVSKSNRKEEKS